MYVVLFIKGILCLSARKDAGCQTVILQPEKSAHLKEPVATDEAGTI